MSAHQKSPFHEITFDRLLAMSGVRGAIFSDAGRLITSRTKLPEKQAAHLAHLARNLCQGYRKAKRAPRKVLMAYQSSALLIVFRNDSQLVLIMENQVDIDAISAAATAYLARNTQRPIRLPAQKRAS